MDNPPGSSMLSSAYASLRRPSTAAVVKMLQKLVAVYPPMQNKKKIGAVDLQRLIERAAKSQKKAMVAQQQLVEALSTWAADLPNEEVSVMMRDFTDLIESVGVAFATQADRLNSFKVKLGAIASREDRQKLLLTVHEQLQRQYNDTALKSGPQAQQATLYLDQIEESEYNLKLIEQQLARTASLNLRAAITEYLTWLQGALLSLGQRSNTLAASIRDGDPASPVRRMELPNAEQHTGDFPIETSKTSPLNQLHTTERKDRVSPDSGIRDVAELLRREDFFAHHVAREHEVVAHKLRDKDQVYDIRNFEENREGWGMRS